MTDEPVIDVIDNFLPQTQFLELKEKIFDEYFPWQYNKEKTDGKDHLWNFQFYHMFADARSDYRSEYFPILQPVLEELGAIFSVRIKANITGVSDKIRLYNMHTDTEYRCKTAVYYLNTNNGKTVFEGDVEVESVENRIAIFDSNLKHTATTHTDEKVRSVINFNYVTDEMARW